MPLIERKVLGSGSASQSDAPITWTEDDLLSKASAFTYIDIALPQSTVLNSVQYVVKNIQTPKVPGGYSFYTGGPLVPLTQGPPQIFQGIMFLDSDFLQNNFSMFGLFSAINRWGVEYVQSKVGSIDINYTPVKKPSGFSGAGTALVRYTDGSYHYLLSVLRSRWETRIITFLNNIVVWYPFSLDVEVTGYALETISDLGVPDEQVSIRVIDETCQSFYGVRPGKEEQSDFIENQTQAARVGEQILWQSQMVLDLSALVPITPAIRRGSTVRVSYPAKNLDVLGLVKNVTHTFNIDAQGMGQGIATTQCEVKATEFIFRTAGGETSDAEKLDKRQ